MLQQKCKLGARFKANQEDEGTPWIQEDAEIQGRTNADTTEILYFRRSARKAGKDKEEAIMKKDESINEEERQRIARDAEIAKQLQEEFDRARHEQEVVAKADQAHDIDWSDPVVLRYHALKIDLSLKLNKRDQEEYFDEDNAKKQKLKDDVEKKELRDSMDVVPRDDIAIDIESLATKYLIVD
ncbi:hypothetical protein Tco_0047262 [Tanacetum coccineum]